LRVLYVGVGWLREGIDFVRSVVSPAVERRYPSKASHEEMSLYGL